MGDDKDLVGDLESKKEAARDGHGYGNFNFMIGG